MVKKNIVQKREIAKIGMSVSLALTVGSAFFLKTKAGKQIHVTAGLSLAAFSLWHHLLYDKKTPYKENDADESSSVQEDRARTTEEVS